jgi:tetratricopeptide (TPR) repeat protein
MASNLRALVVHALGEDAPLHAVLSAEAKLLANRKIPTDEALKDKYNKSMDLAVQKYTQAADLANESFDKYTAAQALNEAATIRHKQRRFPQAAELYVQAADVLQDQSEQTPILVALEDQVLSRNAFLHATILENAGVALCANGKPEEAIKYLQLAKEKYKVWDERTQEEDDDDSKTKDNLLKWQEGYVAVCSKLATIQRDQDDKSIACDLLQESISVLKALIEKNTDVDKDMLPLRTQLHTEQCNLALLLADPSIGRISEGIALAEEVVAQVRTRGSTFTGVSKHFAQQVLTQVRRQNQPASELCSEPGCDNSAPVLRCSQCKSFYYCSRECQVKHWKTHKRECKPQ